MTEEKLDEGLNLPAPTGPIQDFGWLDAQTIGAGIKLQNEQQRAKAMQAGSRGIRNKVWHCDGDYVYFRRKMVTTPMPGAP